MKRNRATLKDFFKRGNIPTETNFADLIDSMLNQEEDAISKLPNDPLKITATGVDEALLDFYRMEQNAPVLSWQIKQKPAGRAGLNISDATTTSRVFIENGSGNVGLGSTTPGARLSVVAPKAAELTGSARSAALLVSAGDLPAAKGSEFSLASIGFTSGNNTSLGVRALRTTDGSSWNSTAIGLGMDVDNTIRAGASLWLHANGNVGIGTSTPAAKLQVSGGQLIIDSNQKLAFVDGDVSNNLKLQLWTSYGLGINPGTLFYAADGNHSWRDASGANERMLLTTAANGGLTVKGTGSSSFAGNLGIGTTPNANAKLEVVGVAAVNDGNAVAVRSGFMSSGSLTIGSITKNFGGGNLWTNNTAGLLLETLSNTEIAVHDSVQRVASLMYYEGDAANSITIGRNMGWGTIGSVVINGIQDGPANDYLKAQFTMSGGGTVTWGGPGGRLKWTQRFIAIPVDKLPTTNNGYININQPTADIPAAQVYDGNPRSATADGIVLSTWEALYAVHTLGGGPDAVTLQVVHYDHAFSAPSNWLLVAAVNAENLAIKLGTGVTLPANTSSSQGSPIPRGLIAMWSGQVNNIPGGWALCNGANGTPNLLDRFIVGAGAGYNPGTTGGANEITLNVSQMPTHNHNNGGFTRLLTYSGGQFTAPGFDVTVNEVNILSSADILPAGSSLPHENRPPFYALAYIMKL